MEHTPTIRSTIETELKQRGYTFSSFSKISGINRGTFSTMLNSNPPKPISVRQMDLITKALGYPDGWLYELYIDECFHEGKGHWKRIKPFLLRCVDLGRKDCIQKVLSRLTEDWSYVSTVFEFAEELHKVGKKNEAVPFYECVVENERYYHSERLAICQYRLFCYSLNSDLDNNRQAAIRFAPFPKNLPENYQLDALLKLTNTNFQFYDYDMAIHYAKELEVLVTGIFWDQAQARAKNREVTRLNTERHLIVYYGQAYLMQGNSLEKQGLYEAAMKFIPYYENLTRIEGLDEVGMIEAEKFEIWGKANRLNLQILMGDKDSLPAYVELIRDNPQEILLGLLTIIESANNYSYSVDDTLVLFAEDINKFRELRTNISYYHTNNSLLTYSRFFLELSRYFFSKGSYTEAINNMLISLEASSQLNDKTYYIKSITLLFEKYKDHSTEEQRTEYEKAIKAVEYNTRQMTS
ncbi:helix-turn-helix transcriptional regulator [Paenibacillus sp. P2(2022)]|uniref:DNA-binding protein n=1 Tax=Paenibacillus polymyxa TaxID=1406 RepID=A0A378Y5M4_PAEPO|nr:MULTISPECIES: helix-turn-helix transcriptional regulator [Paenibacillus]MEB4783669.1 helix-turn-helix transcriptional regulator [Paenibacillus jamilae]AUS28843.1 DNA-binding protein [Paenibacillus polymyxa]KJK29910.1 DNA-binding protein [Paenibacillus polymyxa]MBE7899020.1 DNA-binding protein [Paenibacillus polymyxa]MBG9763671.1 DNA-binding protein [Paenibacillus polymyxa]